MPKKDFFNRDAEIVARELLGKIIVRRISDNGVNKELKAKIVETEAYFDERDPASRARQNGDLRDTMKMKAGTILVYGVHNSWLVNIVTGSEGEASAVLIRAVEPLNLEGKCNGPGLLTKSLRINKNLHKSSIIDNEEIWIEDFYNQRNIGNNKYLESKNRQLSELELQKNSKFGINGINNKNDIEIAESFRVGVKKDLPRKLRFYIKDNKFVSRK